MIDFRNVVYKMPNYVRRFGLVHGLRLLTQIEQHLGRKSKHVETIHVPGFPSPIQLRDTRGDHSIFWQCIVENQYDYSRFPQSARLNESYKQLTKNGEMPLIIDCGANIGLASMRLAEAFPLARIVAVEPDADNFDMLRQNLQQFGDQIRILHGGVWNQGGHLVITNPEAGSASYRVAPIEGPTSNSIRAYSIQDICQIEDVNAPFIVKIDVEGAQKYIFRNNTEWISGTHLIMMELEDWLIPWSGSSRPFFSALSNIPFDYLIRGETIFCFRDFET